VDLLQTDMMLWGPQLLPQWPQPATPHRSHKVRASNRRRLTTLSHLDQMTTTKHPSPTTNNPRRPRITAQGQRHREGQMTQTGQILTDHHWPCRPSQNKHKLTEQNARIDYLMHGFVFSGT